MAKTTPRDFYAECLRRAFRGKIAWAELVAGLLALVAVPVGLWLLPDQDNAIRWLPLILFGGIFVIAFLVGVTLAPHQMFNEIEAEKEELEDRLFSRDRRQAAMARLWQLRAEGVDLRNETPSDEAAWTTAYERWRNQVLTDARIISANLAAWLETLDRMRPPPQLAPSVSQDHTRRRHVMSEILARMEEFLKAEMLNKDIALSED